MILLLETLHPEAEALLERCEQVLRASDPNGREERERTRTKR